MTNALYKLATPPDNIFVDYDSTLYRTKEFADDLWLTLANAIGVPVEDVRTDSKLYRAHARLGGYMFEDHIAKYGLDPTAGWELLNVVTAKKDYLFSDSIPFMTGLLDAGYSPIILSFGEDRCQYSKIIPTLARLAGMPEETTLENNPIACRVILEQKGPYITRYYPEQHNILVDDVEDQKLPAGSTEINLNRSRVDLDHATEEDGILVVSNLMQALDVLRAAKSAGVME